LISFLPVIFAQTILYVYKLLIRPLLFLVDPERIHFLVTGILKIANKIPIIRNILRNLFCDTSDTAAINLWDLKFRNPVGLAAGFDKDANYVDEFSNLGFGFIEIGTVTPKSQPGNPKRRLFRLIKDKALINRMGFNNEGVEVAVKNLKKRKSSVIVGGNIGKNKITPNENAREDYIVCYKNLYDHVDYFVVNVSSPNTPNLRELQEKEPLIEILKSLLELRKPMPVQKPLLLKIAPDLNNKQLDDIIDIANELKLDGIVATNTTISREGLQNDQDRVNKIGEGGLSGLPLKERSTEVIRYLRKGLNEDIIIMGVGGIMNAEDAREKLKAGATLVQVYTGFIYEGPGIVKKIVKAL